MLMRHKFLPLMSIITSLLMILSLIMPSLTVAQAKGIQLGEDLRIERGEKISDRLLNEFEESEEVAFLVKFKETVDPEVVVNKVAKESKRAQLSADQLEQLQHETVINELKAVAKQEQQSVLTYVEEEAKAGNAKNVESFFIVNGLALTATKEVAEKIATYPEVEVVLPDEARELVKPTKETNNTIAQDENVEWNISHIGVPSAWEKGVDGEGIVVAVIDTGVQWDHPALKEKYRGYDAETGEVNHEYSWFDATTVAAEKPDDDDGHGTHVTGTIVGSEPDGSNQIGVAPNAKYISIRAFEGGRGSDSALIRSAQWILEPTDSEGNVDLSMKPDIVNNSWSSGPGMDEWYRSIVKAWRGANIFPQFATGNVSSINPGGPGSVASPANYPESFTSGAVDSDNVVPSWSLRGPSPYGEIKPDVVAPGANIRSAVPGNEYEDGWNGTSMASPAVAGVIALIKQIAPELSISEIEKLVKDTATPLTDEEYSTTPNHGYGYGVVDADKIVSMLIDGVGVLEGHVVNEAGDIIGDAKVTVVESNWESSIDPETTQYRFVHPVGELTLKAEAYGYYTTEQTVLLTTDGQAVDIVLTAIPKRTISGYVTNASTNLPIADVKIEVVEDEKVDPVTTDENGYYELEVYDGDLTVVVNGWNYEVTERQLTVLEEDIDLDVELQPEYKYHSEELAYDDGSEEQYEYSSVSGSSWAVRMSLDEGVEKAYVAEGRFYLETLYVRQDLSEFNVEVWDATGENNAPGEKLFGPFPVKVKLERGQTWVNVDLREHRIEVDGDFYLVYVQEGSRHDVPQVPIDTDGPGTGRSYYYSPSRGWGDKPNLGNYIFRSVVAYDLDDPVIDTPEADVYTNSSETSIVGTSSPETTVHLMNNGDEVDSQTIGHDGKFSFDTSLLDGENNLTTVASFENDRYATSNNVQVTLDTEAPNVVVNTPESNRETNEEVVTVSGEVTDNYGVDAFTVNGEEVSVNDSQFETNILLEDGRNDIQLVATDLAGNVTEQTVSITYSDGKPVISNVSPSRDQYVSAGDRVKISFESNVEGGSATFGISLPNLASEQLSSQNTLIEVEPGVYEGEWTAPANLNVEGATITVEVTDRAGNSTTATAEGKLYIGVDKEINRISGKTRYDTAVEISQEGWDEADTVVVVRGDDYADALAGVPLAYQLDAPILLTRTNSLTDVTLDEIQRLQASHVVVLGGTVAVSEGVVETLEQEGLTVERISGSTRMFTAQAIAERLSPEGVEEAIIVNGRDFPDALSAASFAAQKKIPILLTEPTKLSDGVKETIEKLSITKTTIVGGTLAVSDDVMNQLPNPQRVSGTDRVKTNIAVHEHFGTTNKDMYVATGNDYVDALTGAVLAAKQNQSILLVRNSVAPELATYITEQNVNNLTILGGYEAVNENVEKALRQLLQK